MTKKEFYQLNDQLHDKAKKITRIKNSGYSPGDDPFSNFRKLEPYFGKDWPKRKIVDRLLEKVDRLVGWVVNGDIPGNTEPDDNDIIDVGNYAIILYAFNKSLKKPMAPKKPKGKCK